MTLVPNRLPRLSGNKIIWALAWMMILFISCGGTKQTVAQNPHTQTPKVPQQIVVKKDEAPSSPPQTPVVRDTIVPPKPIVEIPKEETNLPQKNYKVLCFLPLQADQYVGSGSEDERFLHYYAGIRMALRDLSDQGYGVKFVFRDSGKPIKFDKTFDEVDMILGPNDKDQLKQLIDWGQANKVTVVSPWYTSTKITTDNPNYLQMRPNLREHFARMIDHALHNHGSSSICILGRNTTSEKAWFNFIQEKAKIHTNNSGGQPIMVHYLREDSLAVGKQNFKKAFDAGKTVFIVPHYSFGDENFVYNVFRKLNSEKMGREVIVYGMPMLIESDKIDTEFYRALNLRIVLSEFVEEGSGTIQNFTSRYYERFFTLPTKDAIEGYDKIFFLISQLTAHGPDFLEKIEGLQFDYLQSSYIIRRNEREEGANEGKTSFDFYENKYLDVIGFQQGRFRKM